MRRRVATFFFWASLVGVWANISLAFAFRRIPATRKASEWFMFSAAVFAVGAICNYLETRRQS